MLWFKGMRVGCFIDWLWVLKHVICCYYWRRLEDVLDSFADRISRPRLFLTDKLQIALGTLFLFVLSKFQVKFIDYLLVCYVRTRQLWTTPAVWKRKKHELQLSCSGIGYYVLFLTSSLGVIFLIVGEGEYWNGINWLQLSWSRIGYYICSLSDRV